MPSSLREAVDMLHRVGDEERLDANLSLLTIFWRGISHLMSTYPMLSKHFQIYIKAPSSFAIINNLC